MPKDLKTQADPDADSSGLEERYPKAKVADFDGNSGADRNGRSGRLSSDVFAHAGRHFDL